MLQKVDTLIYNAIILTQSKSMPVASSMVIHNGKIIAVFQHEDHSPYQAKTKIDAKQQVIIPGLIDAHCHLQAMISEQFSIHLPKSLQTKEALLAYIREQIAAIPAGEWVRITGYHPFHFRHIETLTMTVLDEISTNHPIRVRYVTRHTSTLNSRGWHHFQQALQQHSQEGIHLELDACGQPTGIIHGADTLLNECVLPKIAEEQWLTGMQALQSKLLSVGITTICDASPTTSPPQLALWEKAAQHFWKIPVQWMTSATHFDELPNALYHVPIFKRGALKIVLETMPEVYPAKESIVQMMQQAFLANSPIAIHVVTPEMVWHALDALQTVRTQLPEVNGACRFEHLSLCPEAFFDMIQEQNIQVVTNPPFIYTHGDRYLQQVDEDEHSWLYPVNALLQKGITVAAGADSPVAPISPWLGIYAACTRKTQDGAHVNSDEAVSRKDALRLYTTNAALVMGEQYQIGQLAHGFDANFVVLSHHPMQCSLAQLQHMHVLETWIHGQRVYSSS
ncbi:amidohydrolase family protein [Lysinibacillus sp. KU-BSD001]|uniref:amidohydrolase n=1 Tax=Lysinibacillus sp. KU-BSD001 TaxID=3141328 RepID=UPI0036EC2835